MASATFNYNLPYPTNTDPVDITGDIQALAEALDSAIYGIGEISQDAAAAMITSASHVNGISASYDDVANRLTFTLAQNIATSASPSFRKMSVLSPTDTNAAISLETNGSASNNALLQMTSSGSGQSLIEFFHSASPSLYGGIEWQPSSNTFVINGSSDGDGNLLMYSGSGTINLTPQGTTTISHDLVYNNNGTPVSLSASLASKANLVSPTFTGIPAAPTASVDTNTTQIATTAYVVGQAGSASPVMDGTATVGTSLLYARQDHIHPTDTSRAPLSSPALTGTPTAPTASVDTSTTQLATTQFVVNQGYLKSASASTVYAPLSSPTFTGTVTAATLDLTTAATATTATSYWVETGSDGVVRPKTLANARTELVTTAAVNSASATILGTITNGTWNASVISATYIDSAIARLSSPALTGTPTAPTATSGTNTTQIATTAFVNTATGQVLPSQTGNDKKILITNGASPFWSSSWVGIESASYVYQVNFNTSASQIWVGYEENVSPYRYGGLSLSPGSTQLSSSDFTQIFTSDTLDLSAATFTINGETWNPTESFSVFEITKDGSAVTGSSQYTFRAPFAMTLTQIPRASLSVASSSGSVSLGITASGSNVFTTNLSIDESEKTSFTAATPAVLGITSIPNDSEIVFDVIDSGTGAEGLKVVMYYKRT